MNSIVYALHEPLRYDRKQRCLVPVDLSHAEEFGDLKVVFPGDPPPPISECKDQLRKAMAAFRPCDRLIIVGDMDLLVFAAVLAAKATAGRLTLLKWDRVDHCYNEVTAPDGLFN